jgi:hypothetical protein
MASYLEIASLRTNQDFKDRVSVAVIKYAAYIMGEPPETPIHEIRVQWARKALANPDEQVFRIMGHLVGNASVQTLLTSIVDQDLQYAVEYAVNTLMLQLL